MTEEYQILSRLLEEKYVEKRTKLIVLRSHFISCEHLDISDKFLQKNLKNIDEATVVDLADKSRQESRIERQFNLKLPYLILEEAEAASIFSSISGWELFYEKFEGAKGLVEVSRVGFNSDHSQALICIGEQKHRRSGYGSYYLLSRKQDNWSLVDSIRAWVS